MCVGLAKLSVCQVPVAGIWHVCCSDIIRAFKVLCLHAGDYMCMYMYNIYSTHSMQHVSYYALYYRDSILY